MSRSVIFDPLLPLPALWLLAALAALMLGFAIWRSLRGWPLRALAMAALGAALLNPSLQEETRKPLSDIILAVVDDSASQRLSDRPVQTEAALAELTRAVAALDNTELRVIRFADGEKDAGSLALTALAEAMAEEIKARLAKVEPQGTLEETMRELRGYPDWLEWGESPRATKTQSTHGTSWSVRIEPPDTDPEAIAAGQALAREVQEMLAQSEPEQTLEEVMQSLRGWSWS